MSIFLNAQTSYDFNKKGDYETAISDYSKVISWRPNFKEAYFHRGSAKYFSEKDKSTLVGINKALKIDPCFDPTFKRQKRIEKAGIALPKTINEAKVKVITPKSKLSLKWGQTELINNTITTQNNIKVKVESSEKDLDVDKFILFINGDSINSAKNILFEAQVFSAEIPLRAGVNDIYVVYEKAYTTLLRIVFKPERNVLYTMIAGSDVSSKAYNYKNATSFSRVFDKQFLLYNERRSVKLEEKKMTSKKIKQGLSGIKTRKSNSLGSGNKDVVITYLSAFAYVSGEQNLRLTTYDFNPRKLERSTLMITDMMDRINALECRKVLFLDIQLNKDYTIVELESIKKKLRQQAKDNGFTLFASVQNQSKLQILENHNSIFTDFLIKGMMFKADKNQDKIISTLELETYLKGQQLDNLVIEVKSDFSLVTVE
jgi:hypothetical protein